MIGQADREPLKDYFLRRERKSVEAVGGRQGAVECCISWEAPWLDAASLAQLHECEQHGRIRAWIVDDPIP